MNIGGLTIEMAADIARMRKDMDDARRAVGDAMEGIDKAVGLAKAAFVAFAGVASVGAFVGMVKGAIDAQGALHDLSQQTGNTAAALGQFKSIGALSETSLDSIAGASLKLSKNLALTDEEGKGAALAIKALGIDFDTFSKLNPDQRMLSAAQALAKFDDGADKSAAAMLLFGKEGAKMLPFLADLAADSDKVTAALSDQAIEAKRLQAAMADAFGDNLVKIRKESEGWKRDLSLGLLPALYEASEAFIQMTGGAGGLGAKISELAKDGTLAEWARNGMTALSYLLDVAHGLINLFPLVGKAIAGVAAGTVELFGGMGTAIKQFIEGDYSKSLDTMKGAFRSVATIGEATANDVAEVWNRKLIGETFRDTMAGLNGVQADAKETKAQLNLVDTLKANEAAQKAAAEATRLGKEEQKKHQQAVDAANKSLDAYSDTVQAHNRQLQDAIARGRELTPVEKELLRLDAELAKAKRVMTAEEYKVAEAKAAEIRTSIQLGGQLELERQVQIEATKAKQAESAAIDAKIKSVLEEVARAQEQNAAIGKTKEQVNELRAARYLALAAQAETIAKQEEEAKGCTKLSIQQRELADAYRAAAKEAETGAHLEAAKATQEAWDKTVQSIGQGLTDSLYRAFESGKSFMGTFWDGVKNTFKTTVLKLGVQAIMNPVNMALGSLLGASSNAMAGTGGAGGGLGMLGSIGTAISAGKSLLSGGMGWLTNFSGSASGVFANAGTSLFNAGFENVGGWIGENAIGLGNVAEGLGSGLSYISSIKALADGRYGAGLLGGAGTFFGGPIGGMIGNFVGGALDKLFGGAGTHHAGAGYVSDGATGRSITDGSMGLGWSYGDSVTKYYSADVQKALETVTGGSAKMLNTLSQAFGGAGGFQVGAYFASDNNRESQGGRSVLKDGQLLSEWAGKGLDKDPTKGLQQLTDALAGQVRSAMGQIDLPEWARQQLDALGSGATMEALANTVSAITSAQQALSGLSDSFRPLGGVFGRVADLSADATMQLAQFAGGIDALLAKTQSFVKNYYSTDEQNAIAAAQIQKALDAAGITAQLGSREDFRALVNRTDVQTEAGRKQLADLLSINETFAPLGDYLKEQGKTLQELAAQAPQVAALQALTDTNATAVSLQQQTADRLLQLDDTFTSVGGSIVDKLTNLIASVEAGLTQVAANTASLDDRLNRLDNGDGLLTVPA